MIISRYLKNSWICINVATFAKKVTFSSVLVSLFVSRIRQIFTKFGGKVAHGPNKIGFW